MTSTRLRLVPALLSIFAAGTIASFGCGGTGGTGGRSTSSSSSGGGHGGASSSSTSSSGGGGGASSSSSSSSSSSGMTSSCTDAIENGNETDVDCGGPDCPACADGQGCVSGSDCQSGVCTNNQCKAPSCTDGVKNGAETGVDCGGGCPACAVGEACATDADCQSLYCAGGVCATAECTDAVKNGAETDVDCGGPVCTKCPAGKGCTSGADCQSGSCAAGVCQGISCSDAIENGDETDVDCGGATCPKCALGQACATGSDCQSGNCAGGTCAAAGPACATAAPNPTTGQRCPLFMPCTQASECGVFTGCQQWFCNAGKCELNALSSCWTSVGGGCNAQVIFTQHTAPPVDKDFLPPDGVSFRQLATIAFTVQNNTASDLYLDKIPLQLDVAGGGSSFDVTSVKMYQDGGGTEYASGDQYVCLTGNPFSFPANGILGNGPEGGCGGSAFARVPANGGSRRFILLLAFGASETYLAGRSYRLRMGSTAGIAFRVGFNGPTFQGTMCGMPNGGFLGAWVNAKTG